jgi:flavin-dependent dehydrogenase
MTSAFSSATHYDVVIIGGAFSGASTALLLRRQLPQLRVLLVERTVAFDKKVGESTSEVAGCFMTRRLHINAYLSAHHYQKHGLRMWFCREAGDSVDDCTEIGPGVQSRLPTFQLDRAKLDTHLLHLAVAAGAEVQRPATLRQLELGTGEAPHRMVLTLGDGSQREITSHWVIDASGKKALLARQLGVRQDLAEEHPTSSVWCRFTGVNDLDSYQSRSRFPSLNTRVKASRAAATNHLTGLGWWCWLIPLSDGTVSAGVVWDRRLFTLPPGASLEERLKTHLLTHPIGRLMFEHATAVPDDATSYKNLAYRATQVTGHRWAMVGDAAGFIDPLYSQGLDYCGHTVIAVVAMIQAATSGADIQPTIDYLNEAYPRSHRQWFDSLYRDKYYYLGDAELMRAAFLLDLACYFVGPVRLVYDHGDYEFTRMPYDGPAGKAFARFMSFYNRRLSTLARRRLANGTYGACNLRHDFVLRRSFSADTGALRLLLDGLLVWARAEWRTFLSPKAKPAMPAHTTGAPQTL